MPQPPSAHPNQKSKIINHQSSINLFFILLKSVPFSNRCVANEKHRRHVGVLDRSERDVPRRGEAPWGGAESMPQGMARHPLLDPCGPGRTLDRLVINRPWQMITPPPGPDRLSRDMTARLRVRQSFHHIDNRHRKIKSVGFSVPEVSSRFLQIKNPKSTINNHQSIPGNRWSAPHTHAGL